MTQPSMIAIQDEFIAKVLGCQTGHMRRVRRGARKVAEAKLAKIGFTADQASQIVTDAKDMADLQRIAD